jgi:hypothetical protein
MKVIKIVLILSMFFLACNASYSDGFFISDYAVHFMEPYQKAFISWDGKTETMILSSSVKSNDISNFAWIIPIQSNSKPEINAADVSIFNDLVDFFKEKNIPGGKGGGGGVNVIETKSIDIYDLVVLKAVNTGELMEWLKKNGYKIPDKAKIILDKYIAKKNYYFIANKINIKNKLEVDKKNKEKILADLKNGLSTPLMIKFQPVNLYFPLEISGINQGTCVIEVYLAALKPAYDKNNILLVDKTKRVNDKIKNNLKIYINNFQYITRLVFLGDLNQLDRDAEFNFIN